MKVWERWSTVLFYLPVVLGRIICIDPGEFGDEIMMAEKARPVGNEDLGK